MAYSDLVERFEQYLIDGGFRPGDKLPGELELAGIFNVSRGTIREIIVHFSLMGVLERKPNRGTVVTAPDIASIGRNLAFQMHYLGCGREELKATRLMLESAMIPEVLRCITPAQLDRLTTLVDAMEAAAADPVEADALDLQFHLALLEITGSRMIQVFSQVLTLLFNREYRRKFLNAEAVRKSAASHRLMLRAIREKDAVKFQELIEAHIAPL